MKAKQAAKTRTWDKRIAQIACTLSLLALLFIPIGFAHASTYNSIFTSGSCTDSTHVIAYDCAKAFDGLFVTSWENGVGGQSDWIKYDLGAGNATSSTLFDVHFGSIAGFGNLQNGGNFKIDVSNDNSTWYSIMDATSTINTELFLTDNGTSTPYRYYRFTEKDTSNGTDIVELDGYNVPLTTTTSTTSTTSTSTPLDPDLRTFYQAMIIALFGIVYYIGVRVGIRMIRRKY